MTEQTQPQPNIVSFSRLLDLAMRILAQKGIDRKVIDIVMEETEVEWSACQPSWLNVNLVTRY